MINTVASPETNPFVGPNALTEEDRLFGRSVELKTLHEMLIADRIVLLYSPSGAGKTSLLHAGLKRLFVQDGFLVRPTIRVTHEVPPSVGSRSRTNRYLLSTLSSLETGRPKELEPAALAEIHLDEYLTTTRGTSNANDAECLFFDQFEELFTVDPIDMDEKKAFLDEVGRALRDPSRWAVFSMREEFVAHLDPYLKLIPTKLRSKFRLDLLGPESARQAIQGPALEAGVEFSAEAASLVVDDLRRVLVQKSTGVVPAKGPTVEPVQLQVVCHRLWTRLGEVSRVEAHHVRELGDVDNALRDFHDDVIGQVAQRTGVSERAIRTWISDELVTEQGYRAQTQHGPPEDTLGRVLPALEDAHLVRADRRRTTVWYELAHDRLVDPIKSSNTRWLEDHLSLVQRGARLWDAQRRDDRALLVGQQLEEGEAWAANNPDELGHLEREFLAASHEEEARVAREQRSTRRVRLLAVIASIVSVVAMAGLIAALWQWQKVNDEKERAERVEQAMTYFFGDDADMFFDHRTHRTRLLLDRMALEAFPEDQTVPVFMLQGINSHLYILEDSEYAGGFPDEGRAAMSGNGRFVAYQTEGGVQVIDIDAPEDTELVNLILVEQSMEPPAVLALSHDGGLLALAPSSDQPGQLWNVAQQKMVRELDEAPSGMFEWERLEFAKSGDLLAGLDGMAQRLTLWEVSSGTVITPSHVESISIDHFDISSTGLLAAIDSNLLHVVDIESGAELPVSPSQEVWTAVFEQSGERLAVQMPGRLEIFAMPAGNSVSPGPIDSDVFLAGFVATDSLLLLIYEEESCALAVASIDGQFGDQFSIDCPDVSWSGRLLISHVSDDGKRILINESGGWSVWSTSDGTRLETSAPPEGTLSAAGSRVAQIDSDGRISVQTLDGKEIYTSPSGRTYHSVVLDGDGDTIVASSGEDLVVIDPSSAEEDFATTLPWPPHRIATSDDARLVAVSSADNQLVRWRAETSEFEELPHSGEITALAVTGSGDAVAAATDDALKIYTDESSIQIRQPFAAGSEVQMMATDPATNALAAVVTPGSPRSASDSPVLFLWDDVEQKPRSLPLRTERPTAIALGREYAAIASDQGVDVYDRRNLQIAGGLNLGWYGTSTVADAVSISETDQTTVISIMSDGGTDFAFSLDREGILKDLDAAARRNQWAELTDEECIRIAGIECY